FNFTETNGRVTGCDVELARHVLRTLGIADFEPVETEFAALLPGLGDGRWRMTTGLFGTEERRRTALFSRPIWGLPDGLLVKAGNPRKLTGYGSIAENADLRLAVIRDQVQHLTAMERGVAEGQIVVFETYADAAAQVRAGAVDAYASVARAHSGFIAANPDWGLGVAAVPHSEKAPAFGSFAFGLNDAALLSEVDEVLADFLGTAAHREMVAAFGFSDREVDLVAARAGESDG
ncbi:MAG: transporter substrate-binding domain-containing protein, partial [Pseudomonadota bacterium]